MKLRLFLVLTMAMGLLSFAAAQPVSFLQDMEGEFQSLDDYTGKGKWLIVMLWASDCHVCNKEAHQYDKFHQTHKNSDAQILGVSADGWANRQDAKDFIQRHKVSFPNLIGSAETVASVYSNLTGASWRGTPTFLVFSPDGELKAQQVGAVPTNMIEDFIRQESENAKAAATKDG